MDETSDVSKLEQFGISVSYLDCKGAKQERFLKFHISKEDRGQTAPFSTKNQNQLKQYGLKHFMGAFIIFWNPSQEYEAH